MMKTKTPTGVWDAKLELTHDTTTTLISDYSFEQNDGVSKIVIDRVEEKPIVLGHKGNGLHEIEVILKQGAQATIVENTPDGVTSKVSFLVNKDATLNYARIQEGLYMGENKAKVYGTLNYFEVNKGSSHNTMTTILEENATFTSTNILLGLPGDTIHITPNITHKKNSTSQLSAKAVLTKAQGIYDGVVHIPIGAPKSIAHQRIDALLLSKDSEMKESPQLYIDNKDVECSHAATSTHANKEQLFYLQTRGLTKTQAQASAIQASIWPLVQELPTTLQAATTQQITSLIESYIQTLEEQNMLV